MKPLLTIMTATYNRGGGGLTTLYNSLKKQTCKDFIWMLVDDGSTDDTEELVKKWKNENILEIDYKKKDNGGKHTAMNYGVSQLKTILCQFVDSDDYLVEDSVDTVIKYYRKYKDDNTLCGYTFLRCFPDGVINGKKFCVDEMIASYIDARINSDDLYSDKTSVFYSFILKQYPFPEIPQEKFLGEDVVWIRMAKKYKMVHINKVILVGEYKNDGLTNNRRANNVKSPNGCMIRANEFMCREIKLKYRIKGAIQYIIYGRFAGYRYKELYKDINDKILFVLCLIPGIVLYKKWSSDYN